MGHWFIGDKDNVPTCPPGDDREKENTQPKPLPLPLPLPSKPAQFSTTQKKIVREKSRNSTSIDLRFLYETSTKNASEYVQKTQINSTSRKQKKKRQLKDSSFPPFLKNANKKTAKKTFLNS